LKFFSFIEMVGTVLLCVPVKFVEFDLGFGFQFFKATD